MSETETNAPENDVVSKFVELGNFTITLNSGEVKKAKIRFPTDDEQRRADEYAATVILEKSSGEPDPITGKVIKLPTKDNMMEYAREKGMWDDEDEMQFTTLEAQLRTNIGKLVKGKMKLSNGYDLATQIMQHRKEIHPYNQRRWEIYGLTADAAGEEAAHKYLCVATTTWENGERIFPDLASFDKGGTVRNRVLTQYMIFIRTANDYNARLDVEIEFFRDYGFLDNDWNLYDASKKNVITNLREPDESGEQEELFAGITDDDGQVIEKDWHPSIPRPKE